MVPRWAVADHHREFAGTGDLVLVLERLSRGSRGGIIRDVLTCFVCSVACNP
jgi:hypothetical protein